MQHIESPESCCNLPCLKHLVCGHHLCKVKCHYGPCPPCKESVHQKCFCGAEERDVPCGTSNALSYSCGRICGKSLDCGHHTCPLACHEGPCPPCPNQPPRKCFCGKKSESEWVLWFLAFVIPCTDPTPSCHQYCDKLLPCGHHCTANCHPPPCPSCLIVVSKKCRCGTKTAEVPCSQEFLCTQKCQEFRSCGRHRCNRRCCDGQHTPCTIVGILKDSW